MDLLILGGLLAFCYLMGVLTMLLWLGDRVLKSPSLQVIPTAVCFALWPLTILFVLICLVFNLDRKIT